jgi:protein-disulfide isomerase
MVEFADFECPYCGRVEATLTELFATYPDDLRLIFKNFPLPMHEHAEDAAVAAECALDQGHFWEMHDLLFASQEALSPADLEGYATTVGLDVGAWQECLTSSAPGERIAVDKALARQSGVSATPTFFINGAVIEGAAPINDFERVINDRLATAQASGIPQDQYYDELQRTPCQ